MEKSVLIFSTHAAFAELSRLSLAENTPYNVKTALTIDEMQTLLNRTEFDLVILDADYPDKNLLNFVSSIQEQHPETGYLVFPPDNQEGHPDLEEIRVDAQLLKPFYLPDFLNSVDKVINLGILKSVESEKTEPLDDSVHKSEENYWLSIPDWYDPARIGDQLDQALAGSNAQGAFILSFGGSAVYRGKLKYTAVSEISTFLLDNVDLENKSDIVRFMHLKADELDHLVYAVTFRENHLLVMIFEKSIPFTMARSNIRQVQFKLNEIINHQLSEEKQTEMDEISTPGQVSSVDKQHLTEINAEEISPEEVEMLKVSQLIDQVTGKKHVEPENDAVETEQPTSDQFESSPQLPDWLTDSGESASKKSAPDAESNFDETLHWVKEDDQSESTGYEHSNVGEELLKDLVFPWDEKYDLSESQKSEEIESASPVAESISDLQIEKSAKSSEFDRFETEKNINIDEPEFKFSEEGSEAQEAVEEQIEAPEEQPEPAPILNGEQSFSEVDRETPVTKITEMGSTDSLFELEPIKAGLSHLNYTCVLVPRFPQHFLVGDLAKRVSEWMPQLCIAFGWRLERLSVRPQYVQWSLIVDPNIAPDKVIKVFRRETSKRLFKIWPDYEVENPSKDFWAPGYLILSGFCPPTQDDLTDFVNQTRMRQGINS